MVKKTKSDYWIEAVRLNNEYQLQKLLGADHKKLHNLNRKMKWNLNKTIESKR